MNNKYKLIKNICSNEKIDNLYDLLDSALWVFSVKLNEDKHNVYRLLNTGLNVNEEFIPKKDETGNWIQFKNSFDHKVVDLDSEFLPDEVSYEMILEEVIDSIKEDIDYYKENEIFNYEGDLDESELEEYLDEVVDDIKNEIVV
jgi:hypothetical protein